MFFISVFFSCTDDHPDLHSFPTRRSSDLADETLHPGGTPHIPKSRRKTRPEELQAGDHRGRGGNAFIWGRSEEHTSELQSLRHLVCRLLLEKTKNLKCIHVVDRLG